MSLSPFHARHPNHRQVGSSQFSHVVPPNGQQKTNSLILTWIHPVILFNLECLSSKGYQRLLLWLCYFVDPFHTLVAMDYRSNTVHCIHLFHFHPIMEFCFHQMELIIYIDFVTCELNCFERARTVAREL